MYTFTRCPYCQAKFEIEREHIGQEAECLECGRTFILWDAEAPGRVPDAPPVAPAAGAGLAVPESFSVGGLVGAAFRVTFSRAWGPLVLGVLIFVAASIVAELIGQGPALLIGSNNPAAVVAAVWDLMFSFAAQILLLSALQWGVAWIAASAARGTEVELDEMFGAFRRYGDYLLVALLQIPIVLGLLLLSALLVAPGLITLAATGAFSSGGGGPGHIVGFTLTLLGGLATVFVGVFVSVRLLVVPPMLLLDRSRPRLTATQCYAESWRLMRGKVISTALAGLVVGLVAIASVLLLCVGYVVIGLPLLAALQGVTYVIAVSDEVKAGRPPAAASAAPASPYMA